MTITGCRHCGLHACEADVDTRSVTDRIAFDRPDGLPVHLGFEDHSPGVTLVTAEVSGFTTDAKVADIVNTTERFSLVLCDLKTLLETGRAAPPILSATRPR